MTYLKTEDDIFNFCSANSIDEISVSNISNFVQNNFNLQFLGYFHSVLTDSFCTYIEGDSGKKVENNFNTNPKVLDLIINGGMISKRPTDLNSRRIALFGKMEDGKITQLFALKTPSALENFYSPNKAKTVDFWF